MSELNIKAPRFWIYPIDVDFYLTLPDGRQIGPNSLAGGLNVTGLAPGDYQLSGQFEGFDPFSLHITLPPDLPFAFQPMKGASIAQRRAFRRAQGQDGKSTILYLQQRKRCAAEFWLGHCENAEALDALLTTDGHHSYEDDDGNEQAVSCEFAAIQYLDNDDPDNVEAGFETDGDDIPSRFAAYSWAAEWAPELAFRASGGHPRFYPVEDREQNCIIMLMGDPDQIRDWGSEGFDISRPGIELRYMGVIDFTYYDGGPPGR